MMKNRSTVKHLNQANLAERWNVSQRTLERWRTLRIGPTYLKLNGRVVYREQDIASYETQSLRLGESAVQRDDQQRDSC